MTTKIILGTVQFGLNYGINNSYGKPNEKTVANILNLAYKNNIRVLDSAEAYGNAHELIGKYHQTSSNKFKVVTKFSASESGFSKNIIQRVEQHLKTLNVESLYGYMFHSFSDFEKIYPTCENEINILKQNGLIEKFGVSIYTNQEFEKLLQYDNIDIVQLPFNLLDNNFQRGELIKRAKMKGIEVHTRSAFLQGLFFKNANELPTKLLPLNSYLEQIKNISKNENFNLNDIALKYVTQQNNIDYVLIGVDTAAQLQENIHALQHKVSEKTMKLIDAIKVKETELLNPSNWNA